MKFFAAVFFVLYALAFTATASYSSERNSPLPVYEGLQNSVHFWEDVFSRYSPDQCIFHDERNLEVVYLVKEIKQDSRNKKAAVQRYEKAITAALYQFSKNKSPRDAFEKLILSRIPLNLQNKDFFVAASDRVRCQRGVDLKDSLTRAKKYLPMIKNVFKERGIPEEVAYLPHLESAFNPGAKSRRGAAGIWQIMKYTARENGLKVNRKMDLRLDPKASTFLAADYLNSVFEQTKSWPLTVMAYNYGPNGVRRAIEKYGSNYMTIQNEHQSKIFKFATRNYYPSFLAVKNITMRHERMLAVK